MVTNEDDRRYSSSRAPDRDDVLSVLPSWREIVWWTVAALSLAALVAWRLHDTTGQLSGVNLGYLDYFLVTLRGTVGFLFLLFVARIVFGLSIIYCSMPGFRADRDFLLVGKPDRSGRDGEKT